MVHVHPSMRSASRALYTLPATRRTAGAESGASTTPGDFKSVLNDSTATGSTGATPPADKTVHTIGTVTPYVPATPVLTSPPGATTSQMAPTAESLFGANAWVTNAGGTDPYGASYGYNKYYFATPATAAKVAQLLGGTVVASNAITPSGPFQQNQPNLMVKMPDGKLINAGVVAGFYDHGYTQQAVDKMIAAEVNGTYMA